jgi:hypothetical protein
MRTRVGVRALAITLLLSGVCACQNTGNDGADGSGSSGMVDPFTASNIARLNRLDELTLWRVGEQAEGPGREPEVPLAQIALANDRAWVFSVDGDSRTDSTDLRTPPDAAPEQAQDALVHVVEEATGREVRAVWSSVDADTWVAQATFVD